MKLFQRMVCPVAMGCLALSVFWPVATCAQTTFTGLVVRVMDGDTLEMLDQGHALRIRLAYIDAPEKGQPFAEKSRQKLAQLCAGRTAIAAKVDTDRYGRTVADVHCQSHHANEELVQEGLAWVYRKYTQTDNPLYAEEASARAARRGLWLDADPTPPWEWRRARRKRSANQG